MRFPSLSVAVACAWIAGIAIARADEDSARIMVVLDASGSMGGQIEDRAKIEIAREAIADFLAGADPNADIGLVAYGHRRKGDCDDIEVLSDPTGDRAALHDRVHSLVPRGKTPLSKAVRIAAETLRFEEEAASVILITDGLENCGGDPCALGGELEELGVDFVCHVVGFDVRGLATEDLECLARETGGLFVTADDVEQLTGALESLAEESMEPSSVIVRAVESEGGRGLSPVTFRWRRADSEEVFEESAGRVSRIHLEPGRYVVVGTYGEISAEREIEVGEGERVERELVFDLPMADASLASPEQVMAGDRFAVEWSGPGDRYDDILLAKPGEKAFRRERIRGDGPVTLVAPIEPGGYEVRYWHATRDRVLATRPVEVLPREPRILAEEEVPISDKFTVRFEDRPEDARYDDLQIVEPGEDEALRTQRIRGESVSIAALSEPGDYELRLWNGDNGVELARKPIRFAAVAVEWEIPDPIRMAEPFTVEFASRPLGRYDDLIIYDGDKEVRRQRIRSEEKVTLTAPAESGDYELRYWSGQDSKVLATAAIEVEPVELVWKTPESVPIGSPLEVVFENRPEGPYHDVRIHDPEGGENVRTARIRGDQVTLESPGEPGDYEIHYWIGTGARLLAKLPLRVSDVEVQWEVPETVKAGERFTVILGERPQGRYDDLEIYDAGADEVVRRQRIRGPEVTLQAPEQTGDYELRYWMGGSEKVQAAEPFRVE